jgi:biopolymer transport protein ExbD
MAFGSMGGDSDGEPNAEINMVPFIDVMLVLLVIFIVTAPLLTHTVKLELPRAASSVEQSPARPLRVSIDAQGKVWWEGEVIGAQALDARFAGEAAREPVPELQIRADRSTPYEHVAQVMSAAARNGLTKIGFVTDPSERR